MVTLQNIDVPHHLSGKLIDISLVPHRYAYKSRDIFADLLTIQQSLIAADDPASFELFNPLHDRRRRKIDFIGDIGEPPPTVILQNIKYF